MYDFRDVTNTGTAPTYSSPEAISLDGTTIEDAVEGYRTLSVSGRESLAYTITDDDRPVGTDGMEYYGKRQQSRTITVRFELSAPSAAVFMARYRKLKDFCKGEGRKLRFADEPNAHYTGTLSSVDAPEAGSLRVVAEMAFYCADPYLESDVTTTVTASVVDGKLTAHVVNDGSGEVYPTYRITHVAENGYLGIVHPGGAFEMGNREEADKTPYTKSERLLTGFTGFSPFTGTNPQAPDFTMNGSLTLDVEGYLSLNNCGSGNWWHGGCYRAKLPPDSNGEVGAKNFYCWFELKYMTGLMGQTGITEVLLTDENDAFIAGFNVQKFDRSGNRAEVYFMIPGGKAFKTIGLTPSVYDENPFNGRGAEDILKEGSKLTFYYFGNYYTINIPEIENKKVTYIYVVLGQLGTSAKYITINKIGKFSATKNFVEKWKDVPNRYTAGSEVVVDTATDAIRVNGLPRNDELVTGSVFAPLPPGETDVEFYPSSWCAANPTAVVEFKKRWL